MTSKYLSIDFGLKRIGIAVSDESLSYSFSRECILNDKNFFSSLKKVIEADNISKIIIGLPLNFKSEKTKITFEVEKFSDSLKSFLIKNSLNIEIEFVDERFTSSIASYNISQSGLKKKKREQKGLVDSVAAQILLQDYLDKNKPKYWL